MARRKPKSEPDLNITSFCDIITVSIVALFMALVIVIDIATKTPKLRLAPYSREVTNMPVYVECRNNQIYPVDRMEIDRAIRAAIADIRKQSGSNDPIFSRENALLRDIGNAYYRIDNSMMAVGALLLVPRTDVAGISPPEVDHPGDFGQLIAQLDTNRHYLVYLVRDDSFDAFRKARDYSRQAGFANGWEYLGIDEPISFEGMFKNVRAEM